MSEACDVLVAGGGVAGVAAAVASARAGCRTVLLERGARLGGIGTRGMLRTICGLYGTGSDLPTETLNGGISREIAAALNACSPQRKATKVGRVFVLPYDSDELAAVCDDLCKKERHLTVRLTTETISTVVEQGLVIEIVVRSSDTEDRIRPAAVIDCTGSGELAVQAGAGSDIASPEERQLDGFTVRVTGIEKAGEALALKVPYVLAEAVKDGELPFPLRFTTFSKGDAEGEGYLKFSVAGNDAAGADHEVRAAFATLQQNLPAFRHAVIAGMSGVLEREGRRIRGEYQLTAEDVLSAKKFTDGIAKNAWPIELWDRSKGTVYRYVPDGEHYDIPFRCLVVQGIKNVLVAGRCISVSHEALGSTRVMGACMAMGEAAGRAAAGLVKEGKYKEGKNL